MKKGKLLLVSYLCRDMKKFSHILFDLDGTLTDNTIGIVNAVPTYRRYIKTKRIITARFPKVYRDAHSEDLKFFFANGYSPQYVVDNFREFYSQHGGTGE